MTRIFEEYLPLLMMAMLPVIISTVLYYFYHHPITDKKINPAAGQVFYGVVFGLLAVIATEYGVKVNGYTMNVRDASPIIAGLIFGAPAGIIAGAIGGIERYFAAYWGAGTFTQLACSISTILCGVFGAVLRKQVFEDHLAKAPYALVAGIVGEVVHMLMVFVTNLTEIQAAFSVVRACTIPMVGSVALSCFLSALLANAIKKEAENEAQHSARTSISVLFQKRILAVVIISFFLSIGISMLIESRVSENQTKYLLSQSLEDASDNLDITLEQSMVDNARLILKVIEVGEDFGNEYLRDLVEELGIAEINITDKNGVIIYSSEEKYIGFDLGSGEQSSEFLVLLHGDTDHYVQELSPTAYDPSVYRKYVGLPTSYGGIIQIGYSSDQYYDVVRNSLSSLAVDKHVGTTGYLIVMEGDGTVVSEYDSYSIERNVNDIGLMEDLEDLPEGRVLLGKVYEQDCYYSFIYRDGYYLIATQTVDEADYYKDLSIYMVSFIETIVFAAIFVLIFLTVRYSIVDNVRLVNESLKKIVEGDLDEKVNVTSNREFYELSAGINATVDRLKEMIAESQERMKKELDYAAEIQQGSLPSRFPAFPSRTSFDIYAMMDPAKEVGGDFYDFYLIGEDRLAILVADVSGKGIPASLFMMKAKAIIKSYAENDIAVNDIFTNANFNLCEGNEAGLFVTAWMGIIDLKSGHVDFANAGHNLPLIRHNGTYEYLEEKAGFVLGGMEDVCYEHQELQLDEGDEIFVYTDGLTEAQNIAQELYGDDRLKEAINSRTYASSKELCEFIKGKVDEFVGEAEQFDDLTMLHFRFIHREK